MIRKKFSILLLFTFFCLAAQETFIPFRQKDQFGLANLKGKIVLKPQYDRMYVMGNNYFGFAHVERVTDTIHYYNGSIEIVEKEIQKTGVVKDKKELITNQKYPVYTIGPYMIMAGNSSSYIQDAMLFNMKGEPLFSKEIATFQAWSPVFENDEIIETVMIIVYEDKTYDIVNFDVKLGKIKQRILENLKSLEIQSEFTDSTLQINYADENNYYHSQYIVRENNQIELVEYPSYSSNNQYSEGYSRIEIESEPYYELGALDVAVPPIEEKIPPSPPKPTPVPSKPKKPAIFSMTKDNKLLIDTVEYKNVNAYTFEFIDAYKKRQIEPLIFTIHSGKKGLFISENTSVEAQFDHLQYIKNSYVITIYDKHFYYLAGKKDAKGKLKYGILKPDGTFTVPMIYDSIQIDMLETAWNTDDENNKRIELRVPFNYSNEKKRVLDFRSSGFLDSNKGFMVAFKNGKSGLIDLKNQIYLPFEYDNIFKNGYSFVHESNFEMKDEFIILKQGNKYGIVEFNSQKEITKIVNPIFPEIPTRYFPNYNGNKDVTIYSLSTNNEITYCFANENGKIYLKN